MKAKEPLWTKSYIMLMLGNLFVFMSFQMLIPTLPPYIKSIGASGLEIGLVTALFSIGAVLSRPFIGYMLEYKERKSLVLIGVISLLIVTLLYPVSQLVVLFLVFRFLHGLAWGWSTTVNGTVASDIVPSSRLGEGLGYFGLSITLGMIIAPSLGIYLFQVTSFSNLIYISAILGLISICLLFLIRYQTPDTVKATKKEDLKFSYLGSLVEKSSWYPAFITIIATFGYGSVVTFIVIFGEERGIDQIFLFYLFNAIMATISRPISGKWFDKNGPMGIVLSCLTLTFIGLWVLSMAYSNLFIIISGILFGIGFGSLIPTLQSWTLSKTPPNRRGVANGMLFSAIDLGIGLGGLVFGILATFFDIATLFQLSSIFLVIAIIATLFEGRKNKIAQQHSVSS
ncbi:MFS transporter [Cytobacillus sp. IB215316]|uniref:MFS transporter n=1 Tax=Cytobacillus sp. IB215316 TaxID=3097354 RepID=UPI002A100F73|nr:MFS transporter [Cytobacillus sp. IB215316]MDX8361602.1 MFS transporter [Cytobacillus sp. IB215316]